MLFNIVQIGPKVLPTELRTIVVKIIWKNFIPIKLCLQMAIEDEHEGRKFSLSIKLYLNHFNNGLCTYWTITITTTNKQPSNKNIFLGEKLKGMFYGKWLGFSSAKLLASRQTKHTMDNSTYIVRISVLIKNLDKVKISISYD